jgi:hypothetical protein
MFVHRLRFLALFELTFSRIENEGTANEYLCGTRQGRS